MPWKPEPPILRVRTGSISGRGRWSERPPSWIGAYEERKEMPAIGAALSAEPSLSSLVPVVETESLLPLSLGDSLLLVSDLAERGATLKRVTGLAGA